MSQFKLIYSLLVSFLQDKEIQELTAELENASQQCEAHRELNRKMSWIYIGHST